MPTDPHPTRIQRKRTKGWRMPEGAVYVGRGSKWGNPYAPGYTCCFGGAMMLEGSDHWEACAAPRMRERCPDQATAVAWFRELLLSKPYMPARARHFLRGRNLACWCPPEQPCHADVLLEIANA